MADTGVSIGRENAQESDLHTSEENRAESDESNASAFTSHPKIGETLSEDQESTGKSDVLTLKECCRDAFRKMTEYLHGELHASVEDYVLLEKLNNLAVSKYGEMSNTARTLITAMEELDKKYKSLEPYLEQIDKVEESVASLEQAAYRLDAYSKRLEAKFKKLERR